VKGNAVFIAAIISEFLVIIIYRLDKVSFLWLNVIGALLVIFLSMVIQFSGLTGKKSLNVDTSNQ